MSDKQTVIKQSGSVMQGADRFVLSCLAALLNGRGTRPSRGRIAMLCSQRPARDWRHVAARYLRRFVGGTWHVGGHHVGRLNYGPAIGEARVKRGEASMLRVDGYGVRLELLAQRGETVSQEVVL